MADKPIVPPCCFCGEPAEARGCDDGKPYCVACIFSGSVREFSQNVRAQEFEWVAEDGWPREATT